MTRDIAGIGLRIHFDDDGTAWLLVKATSGKQAALNLHELKNKTAAAAFVDWAYEQLKDSETHRDELQIPPTCAELRVKLTETEDALVEVLMECCHTDEGIQYCSAITPEYIRAFQLLRNRGRFQVARSSEYKITGRFIERKPEPEKPEEGEEKIV